MKAENKGIVKVNYLSNLLKEFLLSYQVGHRLMDADIELLVKELTSNLNPDLCDLSILRRIVDELESQNKL